MKRPPWLLLVVGGLALLGAGCRATEQKPPSETPWLAGKWGKPNDQTADFSLIRACYALGQDAVVECGNAVPQAVSDRRLRRRMGLCAPVSDADDARRSAARV